MKGYKDKLDELNQKANEMFEHMKDINKLVNKKIMDIEHSVTKSESLFVKEINLLIDSKDIQQNYARNKNKRQAPA